MGTLGNRDCQRASRIALKEFTDDAQFVPKWDCPNGEGELAKARTAPLLVELECVAA